MMKNHEDDYECLNDDVKGLSYGEVTLNYYFESFDFLFCFVCFQERRRGT